MYLFYYITVSLLTLYTVSHKKTCHFVFDYNSGFSWSIFILFALLERGRINLHKSLKNLPLHPNCVSTLPGKTKMIYKQHILMSIITMRSTEPVVSNLRRNLSNGLLFQFLVE